MLRLMILVVDLFRLLPWWGALVVLAAAAVGFQALGRYLMHRLHREVSEAVMAQGTPLADAIVEVHSVEPAETPMAPSLIGFDPDDENYDPDLDGELFREDGHYFWIEATIAPHDPQAAWDPSALSLVDAGFEPREELEFCRETALLHAVEVWRNGEFVPQGPAEVTGPQRLRLLFAAPAGMTHARFAYHFTCFGHVTLPSEVFAAGAGLAVPAGQRS